MPSLNIWRQVKTNEIKSSTLIGVIPSNEETNAMSHDSNRATMIMGAGAVLDMDFPCGVLKPSTWNITKEVKKPYEDVFDKSRQITIVEDIYSLLLKTFPVDSNIWWAPKPEPSIHFEILFHVMEQLLAYEGVWADNNHNPHTFPHFAPFTTQNFKFDSRDLNQVMWKYILRIMDIVNAYNEYFRNDGGRENWYIEFFQSEFKWDVFNFNYDTTVEQCLGQYEDGFEPLPNRTESIFRPQKLKENANNLSTINHIHGCINYFYKDNANDDMFETNIHDLYLYPDYNEVRNRMIGRGQSNQASQNNEEYFAGPIITGLRKTEKLSCMPYDFYHGNLYNAILNSNAMVIVGYSFGDIYVNNVINRMHAIWRGKERIVLIDKWDGSKILGYKTELEKYMQTLSRGELEFMMLMSGTTTIGGMINDFVDPDVYHPKYSKNGSLMLITSGMKVASSIRDEIYDFLES